MDVEELEKQMKDVEAAEATLAKMKADIVILMAKENGHVPINQGGNCMMNGKVIGVFDSNGVIPVSEYVSDGALRPSAEFNNPYSFIQSHNYDGKYCIGAAESEINVVIDLKKSYRVQYFSLFFMTGDASEFRIKKYTGESSTPLPNDPLWRQVSVDVQVDKFNSQREEMKLARIVDIVPFETRFVLLNVKGGQSGRTLLHGLKAFI